MSCRILIAEGNDKFAAALEQLLQRRGLRAERARDGEDALQRIVAQRPDLLLLDLRLPRLGGVELLKKLRRSPRTADLPVVISTGIRRGEAHARTALTLGVAAYLEKPFRPSELLAAIEKTLYGAANPPRATIDRHLLRAFTSRFSGCYTLDAEDGERALLFLDGSPVSLSPGFAHCDFGDYLNRKGLLSRREYDYYQQVEFRRHDLPVQMGCLEYSELFREKLAYLTEELVEAFSRSAFAVTETPFAVPPDLQPITVNMPRIFYQGYRHHPQRISSDGLLQNHAHLYVALAPDYFRLINFLVLDAEEKDLVSRLDGRCTLDACLEGRRELLPLVATMKTLGMIALDDRPLDPAAAAGFPLRMLFNAIEEELEIELPDEPLESFADLAEAEEELVLSVSSRADAGTDTGDAPEFSSPAEKVRRAHGELADRDYYGIFGLNPGKFSIEKLKERYFAMTRQYGPETLMQLAGEEASMVEEILDRVATAYNTLSDVVKKERYDELLGSEKVGLGRKGDDHFQARVQFQSGKVFLEMEDWDSAAKALQDACNIDPNSGAYLAHLAWALYRDPKNAGSRAMGEKAKQMLNRAITMERTAEAFAFKGWMLLEGEQSSLAEGEFSKALKLDARQILARKGLRTVRERREQEKKGMFRKMFR